MTKKPNLPAKRYELFISAWEKKVAEAQKELSLLERLSGPYEVVRRVLEEAKLENESSLDMSKRGITLRIQPLDTDRKQVFIILSKAVGVELNRLRFHEDGVPAEGKTSYDFYYVWQLRDFNPIVEVLVVIDVPINGTPHIKILETDHKTETITSCNRRPVWIEDEEIGKEFEAEVRANKALFEKHGL